MGCCKLCTLCLFSKYTKMYRLANNMWTVFLKYTRMYRLNKQHVHRVLFLKYVKTYGIHTQHALYVTFKMTTTITVKILSLKKN